MTRIPALLALACAVSLPAQQPDALAPFRAGENPRSLEDLKALEAHLQSMVARVTPSVVNIGGGSGVIVEGNLVLTAGHVIRRPGREVTLVLHDGRKVKGETLGLNDGSDTGLVKIVADGEFPGVPMGRMKDIDLGHWCFEMGHPGGRRAAGAPLRLGRVLAGADSGWLTTDCMMSGGDSGGPLFDLDGRVIGINSRISADLNQNMHVPIDAFHKEWEDLVAGTHTRRERSSRTRGLGLGTRRLGVELEDGSLVVRAVRSDSPAGRMGLQVGDEIVQVGGTRLEEAGELTRTLIQQVGQSRGAPVRVVVKRERFRVELSLDMGIGGGRRQAR